MTRSELRVIEMALLTDIKEITRLIERVEQHAEILELSLQDSKQLLEKIQKYLGAKT